ncbi:MAG: hypothetical protein HOQ14_12735 [Gemmatimonadaceae bacterium]|nr:hypothetical protein [Gemmatimonadaceae bacterium]
MPTQNRRIAQIAAAIGIVALQLAAACTEPTGAIPFPDDAIEVAPGAPYARWWTMTQSCAGHARPMGQVHFYVVPRLSIDDGATRYAGYWYRDGNRIVLAQPYATDGAVVRHEMLHALLQRGDHQRVDFVDHCGGIVDFGDGLHEERAELLTPPGPSSPVLSPSQFKIELVLAPQPIALTAPDSGWLSATVIVTNPRDEPVWARIEHADNDSIGPTLGVTVDGLSTRVTRTRYSVDTLVAFGPREVKRQVLDIKLDAPLTRWRARALFNADTGSWAPVPVQR